MNEFTKEQMLAAYRALPEMIKDALADPQNNEVMLELQKTYQLHVDTIALVNRETSCLLLGLINPAQYADRLRAKAGLTEQVAAAVIAEINSKIFVPLHEKMRAGGEGKAVDSEQLVVGSQPPPPVPQPASPSTTHQLPPTNSPSAAKPTMATPMTEKVLNRLAPKIDGSQQLVGSSQPQPQPALPTAPPTNNQLPTTNTSPNPLAAALAAAGVAKPSVAVPQTSPVPQPRPVPQVPQRPVQQQEKTLPLPPGDMFLNDHEEKGRSEQLVVGSLPKTQSVPPVVPTTNYKLPPTNSPPINQFAARPAPPPAPAKSPSNIPAPVAKKTAPAVPLVKEYSVDPYREQPEEHEK